MTTIGWIAVAQYLMLAFIGIRFALSFDNHYARLVAVLFVMLCATMGMLPIHMHMAEYFPALLQGTK